MVDINNNMDVCEINKIEAYSEIKPFTDISLDECIDYWDGLTEVVGKTELNGITKEGLSNEQKMEIKKTEGWSDDIIDCISSPEECAIYKKAELREVEISGNKCLIRKDIDWNQKDAMGRTNIERAEQGLSAINKDGKIIELHHIGQSKDAPLAELTQEEHRGKGNDTILHDKTKESEIDRNAFAIERSEHWADRLESE